MSRSLASLGYIAARRVVIAVVGATLLGVGVILIFTPGPAIAVLALGLSVLAAEFAWARRWLRRIRRGGVRVVQSVRGGRDAERDPPSSRQESGRR